MGFAVKLHNLIMLFPVVNFKMKFKGRRVEKDLNGFEIKSPFLNAFGNAQVIGIVTELLGFMLM